MVEILLRHSGPILSNRALIVQSEVGCEQSLGHLEQLYECTGPQLSQIQNSNTKQRSQLRES